jgi:hypothetical protein
LKLSTPTIFKEYLSGQQAYAALTQRYTVPVRSAEGTKGGLIGNMPGRSVTTVHVATMPPISFANCYMKHFQQHTDGLPTETQLQIP